MISKKRTIVHITSEVAPFYKRGGLGDVAGALPIYLQNPDCDNIVISLYYDGKMNHLEEAEEQKFVIVFQSLPYRFSTFSVQRKNILYYFIRLSDSSVLSDLESNDGFKPYAAPSAIVPFFYFARAALEIVIRHNHHPDFLFSHDWQTGGVFAFPDILGALYAQHPFTKVFMIHNYDFQGPLYQDICRYLEPQCNREIEEILHRFGHATLLALALKNCDYAAAVSHTYARELMARDAPHLGLDYLSLLKHNVHSFLNGSDTTLWQPRNNPLLALNYDEDSLHKKQELKLEFLSRYSSNGDRRPDQPLVLMLCRLTTQKGIGLFADYFEDEESILDHMRRFLDTGIRFVIHGNPAGGMNSVVHQRLSKLAKTFGPQFIYLPGYSEESAHQLLAAADILLAPSLFEPCGLIQIYAMAFGTVPIVRPVGGMKDTVDCTNHNPGNATGFHIPEFTRQSLVQTVKEAVAVYQNNPQQWRQMMKRGMNRDFSWNRMKQQYFNFFEAIEQGRPVAPTPL
jgi:starch synthase